MYNQTNEFVYLGGNVNHTADLSIEVDRFIRMVQLPEVHPRTVRPTERPPRAQNLDATTEVLQKMLYGGCVTWSLRACHYDTLRRAHYSFLNRFIGQRDNNGTDLPISCMDNLMKAGSQSVDAIMRGRWIPCGAIVART